MAGELAEARETAAADAAADDAREAEDPLYLQSNYHTLLQLVCCGNIATIIVSPRKRGHLQSAAAAAAAAAEQQQQSTASVPTPTGGA